MKLPEELVKQQYWICWKPEEKDGKITKIPVAPWATGHDGPTSVTDPQNYTIYQEALKAARKHRGWGVGFVFTDDNPYTGIDFDHCIDA